MPWSRVEVEAIVADYVAMLTAELRGEPDSKTVHRRALAQSEDDSVREADAVLPVAERAGGVAAVRGAVSALSAVPVPGGSAALRVGGGAGSLVQAGGGGVPGAGEGLNTVVRGRTHLSERLDAREVGDPVRSVGPAAVVKTL